MCLERIFKIHWNIILGNDNILGLPRPWNNWKIIITILVGALYKPTWSTATVFRLAAKQLSKLH